MWYYAPLRARCSISTPIASSTTPKERCAAGDRYFWSFHDYFFEHQKELKPGSLTQSVMEYAGGLSGFNPQTLKTCLDEKTASAAVDRDVALGKELGVTGTPTIFVNGERLTGFRAEQIRALIERAGTSRQLEK
jgi:protein-disulfide isomerase